MKKILCVFLAVGSVSAFAKFSENEFTYDEWKTNCYEKFVGHKNVNKESLTEAMSCTAGKKMGVKTYFGVSDPFREQARPLDSELQRAYEKCFVAYEMLADSKTFGEVYHNRAAVSALFFCMGQNP